MRKQAILLSVLLLACAAVVPMNAQVPANESVQPIQLKNGPLTMTVDVAKGGKILSFKHGDTEVISQLPWREAFGSTFWTSPQKEWNWPPVPEFDKLPYTVEQHTDTTLIIRSQRSERLKYSVAKAIRACTADKSFVITYSIFNESDETRQVAPWEITRVANEGVIFFDAMVDSITPAGVLSFISAYGAAWYQTDEANDNRKINADGKGWLAWHGRDLLLVKTFQNLQPAQSAPGEAEVQVYVNRGKTFIELESQGAYTKLSPGERLEWTVGWHLLPAPETSQPSASLMEKVRQVVSSDFMKSEGK